MVGYPALTFLSPSPQITADMMSTKAFTLVSAVEWELLAGDKERVHIECVECCGKNLYVGTGDCVVYHFLLEERALPTGTATFSATKQLHRHLGFRKPVSELRAASALNRLLVLCDNSITLLNMMSLEPVPSGARIKGAVALALNENPVSGDPFCVEVCIISVKRRTIQLFLVYEDRVQIVREVSTPEQPLAVAVDGHFLCLALTTQYIILNYNTGFSQDLFPYCSEEKRPIVKRIGRQEFLLAGPGGLGEPPPAPASRRSIPSAWPPGTHARTRQGGCSCERRSPGRASPAPRLGGTVAAEGLAGIGPCPRLAPQL